MLFFFFYIENFIFFFFFFSSRRRHTRFSRDWSSDVCSSDLATWACSDSASHSGFAPPATAGTGPTPASEPPAPAADRDEKTANNRPKTPSARQVLRMTDSPYRRAPETLLVTIV